MSNKEEMHKNVEAGWYPDPAPGAVAGSLRFWDGVKWGVETKLVEGSGRFGLAGDPDQYLVPSQQVFPSASTYSPPAPQFVGSSGGEQVRPGFTVQESSATSVDDSSIGSGSVGESVVPSTVWSKNASGSRKNTHVFYIALILVILGIGVAAFSAIGASGVNNSGNSPQITGSISASQESLVAANLNKNVDGFVDVAFTSRPSFIAEGMDTTPMYGVTVYLRAESFSASAIEQSLVSISESGVDETLAVSFVLQYTNPSAMVPASLMDINTILSNTPTTLTAWLVDSPSGAIVYVEQLRDEVKDKLL